MGNLATFRQASELGVGVLTPLIWQDLDELAKKISIYRQAFRARNGTEKDGHIALMEAYSRVAPEVERNNG